MVSGRVKIQRKPAVQAPAPQSPAHRSSRGRNENAACMSMTKKYMNVAQRSGIACGTGGAAQGVGGAGGAATGNDPPRVREQGGNRRPPPPEQSVHCTCARAVGETAHTPVA